MVIEVNSPGEPIFDLVLGNATNLRLALAPEKAEIEVVCHGPGIGLLLAHGRTGRRVTTLAKSGIQFAACANTLRGRHLAASSLPAFVRIVPSGVAELVRRQETGWSYLKGGY